MKLTGKRAEPLRWQICCVILGFLLLAAGLKLGYWQGVAAVSVDCQEYLMFDDASENIFGCYKITGSKGKYL